MVAQNSADFPIFRGHARQRERGFEALAQTLGRTAIPFIKKNLVPAAERIGADSFETTAPEIGKVVSGSKNTQNICKRCGNKIVRKQLGGGKKKSKRRTAITRSISQKSRSKNSRSRKDIFDNIK